MPIDMFPRTIENRLKIGRNVPILRHQSARIEPCGDGCSSVTKQGIKYRNRLKIRDSERFAVSGSLPESLFSCFDNSVIVCLLIG